MATSLYSASLRLALPTTGDLFGTWGTEINNSITNMVDQAVAGRAVVSMPSDANYTLTALNGTSDEARCAVIRVTSAVSLTATRNIVVPLVPKLWIVDNATTGGQRIQVIGSSGTGITIPNGRAYWVRCDGTNVVMAVEDFAARIGSESTPSYTFNADSNTGMYSPGANQLAWTTDGVKRGEIDSSGHWGFGAAPVSTALKYAQWTASSIFSSEYGDYMLTLASNTSGAVSKIGTVGVSRAVTGYAGTGAVVGVLGAAELVNAVTAPLLYGVQGAVNMAAAGTITTAAGFTTAVTNSGGATVTNLIGYLSSDMTVGTGTLIAGYYGNVTTGTGKWNLYIPGTARSYHAGRLMVGTATENTSGAKLQVSDGVTFPATQVASSDANTLDDYEEGTWTPTLVSGTGGTTFSDISPRVGYYTKIGNVCTLTGLVLQNVTASGSAVDYIYLNGLPFASKALGSGFAGGGAPITGDMLSSGYLAGLYVAPSGFTVLLFTDAGLQVTGATISSTAVLRFCFQYLTA